MNSTMPLVSIIIPVYNVEKYLCECLDSVMGQTYRNLEIILVDDSSPDSCGKICDEYADSDLRIKVIHKENGGVSSARNAGIEAASGEWMYFIDSDDIIEENLVETVMEKIFSDSSDMCFFDFDRFCSLGRELHRTILSDQYFFEKNGRIDNMKIFFLNSGIVWAYIVKSEIIKKNIRFAEDIKCHEDDLFKFQLYGHINSFSYVPKVLYHYRIAENSITQTVFQKDDYAEMVLKIYNLMLNAVDSGNYPDNAMVSANTKLLQRFPWLVRCAFRDRMSIRCDFGMIKKYMNSDEYCQALQNYDKEAITGLSNRLYLLIKKPNRLYITTVYLLMKIKSKVKNI